MNEEWKYPFRYRPFPMLPTGPVIPRAGKVVGIVEFKGRVIVALEFGVYELIDECLVSIKFEGEGEAT